MNPQPVAVVLNDQQLLISPPTRDMMRLIFELALSGAKMDSTQQSITLAAAWFEGDWARQDQAAQEAAKKKSDDPPQ